MGSSDETAVHKLEMRLAQLSTYWRKEHSIGNFEIADAFVQEYHLVFSQLRELGWDGKGLLPDSELPDELMPESYTAKR